MKSTMEALTKIILVVWALMFLIDIFVYQKSYIVGNYDFSDYEKYDSLHVTYTYLEIWRKLFN